ncbi:ty3-gypsy retrotransposon protein [Cucumis melo var. makuwa]|uniref:Ty3-gypsy retrotransposon protein n=1 Tax=Cucumis melo var. makuwa TaxID=1194695 RepID=A0A5A7TFE4_CUCMM|nr:ty3-gypsy retrotransposon protein [Cucumis melo var. makuwa]
MKMEMGVDLRKGGLTVYVCSLYATTGHSGGDDEHNDRTQITTWMEETDVCWWWWRQLSKKRGKKVMRLRRVDSLDADSIKEYSQISGKGFLTTGPRIEAGNVVTHMGIIRNVTVSCSLCAIICNELFTDRHRCPDVLCIVVMLVGYVVNWNSMLMNYKVLMLCKDTARGRPARGKKDA